MYSLMNVNCSVWSKIINVKVSPNIGIKYSRFITGTEGVVGVQVCWEHCYHDVVIIPCNNSWDQSARDEFI